MTEPEIRDRLRRHVESAGSLRRLAATWGVSAAYLSDCLNGRRTPGPAVLGPMGYERVVAVEYRPKAKGKGKERGRKGSNA